VSNFDEISQFTRLRSNYFRFRKMDGRHIVIFSGLDFDACVVIGISFFICLPNLVVIGRSAAELGFHIKFSRWRP